jgi:hypothetical protein
VSPVVGSGASFTSLITLCDTLLSRIDLMLQLIFAASDIMQNLSLSGYVTARLMGLNSPAAFIDTYHFFVLGLLIHRKFASFATS